MFTYEYVEFYCNITDMPCQEKYGELMGVGYNLIIEDGCQNGLYFKLIIALRAFRMGILIG